MKTKREESILDIISTFEEMSDLVLAQLMHLEKFMTQEQSDERDKIRNEIMKNENKIDKYEVLISDKFINSIVLYQPVASDIRKIVAIYRMSINLERIGDVVLNILTSIDNIRNSDEFRTTSEVINGMLMTGITMVEKSLLSFINNDSEYAIWTIKNDEVVDEMNHKLLINSMSKVNMNNKTRDMILSYLDMKNIITNIERIGDHATNIAEASIYSLKGTDIRHSSLDQETKTDKENK